MDIFAKKNLIRVLILSSMTSAISFSASSLSTRPASTSTKRTSRASSSSCKYSILWWKNPLKLSPSPRRSRQSEKPYNLICCAAEYKFPDPIPEFADSETEKFRAHLLEKLHRKNELYGDSIEEIVGICMEILSKFLHTEYGGPGTLMVEPFIDMNYTITDRGLPGGPQAARKAVKWAQKNIDNDWNAWNDKGGS
ncbi:unnamed protein product [Cuscuta epithymum]|uniref:Uncharacterized protein n=1 Tax=Cuscuta epithymum TaxID=186058 RepID=A0AAV0G2U8_9ASTE|nr:unnamed protein product [Cuscuta epithymum]CAH9142284.1 unnamed protein product [Cuscuta epithymum]